jgi:hypothetical protein
MSHSMLHRPKTQALAFGLALFTSAVALAQPPPPSTDKAPARVPFRGTNITWDHAVTAAAFGIGRSDTTNTAARYTQGLGLAVNLFLIDPTNQDGNERGYSLRATSALGFDVDLASSRAKTRPLGPQLRDIPLSLILSKPLWRSENKEWALTSAFNASFSLPTSSASRAQGIHFSISPRASLFLQIPILGQESDFLASIQLGLSVRYDHRFSRAAIPLDPNLLNPRSAATGHPIQSDQLAGGPIDSNGPGWGGSLYMAPKLFGGEPRDLFKNPAALFTASLIIAPDAIFERLTGPARDRPVVLFGRDTQRPSFHKRSHLQTRQPRSI